MTSGDVEISKTSSHCRLRDCRDVKRYLRDLIKATEVAINMVDLEMNRPSDVERGKRIASIMNSLEMQKDLAKRFGLAVTKRKKS